MASASYQMVENTNIGRCGYFNILEVRLVGVLVLSKAGTSVCLVIFIKYDPIKA